MDLEKQTCLVPFWEICFQLINRPFKRLEAWTENSKLMMKGKSLWKKFLKAIMA
jgi:hypothetical protein